MSRTAHRPPRPPAVVVDLPVGVPTAAGFARHHKLVHFVAAANQESSGDGGHATSTEGPSIVATTRPRTLPLTFCDCLFGPVLLTGSLCGRTVAVTTSRSTSGQHTALRRRGCQRSCAACRHLTLPDRRLVAAGHSRQRAGIRTRRSSGSSLGCAANFCLGVAQAL
jgi:hypothetical protein